MKTQLHKALDRGVADHGWLKSFHSFSFAGYYNEERMGVGLLRVINDDTVAPGKGFGTHPHQNMEIISIPLSGSLKHKDTMGNETIITDDEVQAMSAGSGVAHSEYNASESQPVNFLQIWIITKEQGIPPHYSQEKFNKDNRKGTWQKLVSPDGENQSVKIHQDAYIFRAELEDSREVQYHFQKTQNLVYVLLLSGEVSLSGEILQDKDALLVLDTDSLLIKASKDSDILLIEIPRQNS